jgi:hypothetical protein
MGDGILAQFGSATDSVQCAIEIQRKASKELDRIYQEQGFFKAFDIILKHLKVVCETGF